MIQSGSYTGHRGASYLSTVMYDNNQVLIMTINSCYIDHHSTNYRGSAGDV